MLSVLERCVIGVVWAFAIAWISWRRRSLSLDGSIAAFVVGVLFTAAGLQFAAGLVWFFVSSTLLTKLGGKRKSVIEDGYVATGNRSAIQVLANSLPGAVCAIVSIAHGDGFGEIGIIASLCCAIGDTWSSEVGVLSTGQPRLILNGKKVPPGTNGGVSALGFAAAVAGGMTMALVVQLANLAPVLSAETARLCGTFAALSVLGSVIDSLLGATLQISMYDPKTGKVSGRVSPGSVVVCGVDVLSNHQVNLVSQALSTLLALLVLK
jgi:uncharacterized protein (TIGR00297 family)